MKTFTPNTGNDQKHFTQFIEKLLAKKVIDTCRVTTLVLEDGRMIEVFYRVMDGCRSHTDEEEKFFDVEAVKYLGRIVNLTSSGRQNVEEWLYRNKTR